MDVRSSFLPDNFENAKSIKLQGNDIKESQGLSAIELKARHFFNKITGGRIATNPKLDKAILSVTGCINNENTKLSFKDESRMVNELSKLYEMADQQGANEKVKKEIYRAIDTVKKTLTTHINKPIKDSEITICTYNIGGSLSDYAHTLKYAKAMKNPPPRRKLNTGDMEEIKITKETVEEITEARTRAQKFASKAILDKRPNILCLQEVFDKNDNPWVEETFSAKNDYIFIRPKVTKTTGKGENKKSVIEDKLKSDTAVVLDLKKFKFIDNQSFVANNNDVTLVIAKEISTGKKIAIMSAHLEGTALENMNNKISEQQFRQDQIINDGLGKVTIDAILEKYQELSKEYDHVIIGGDLNAEVISTPHRFEPILNAGIKHFSSGDATNVYTGRKWAHEKIERKIDHILVGNPEEKFHIHADNIGVKEISLLDPTTSPSDHLPVYLKLNIISNLKQALVNIDKLISKINTDKGVIIHTNPKVQFDEQKNTERTFTPTQTSTIDNRKNIRLSEPAKVEQLKVEAASIDEAKELKYEDVLQTTLNKIDDFVELIMSDLSNSKIDMTSIFKNLTYSQNLTHILKDVDPKIAKNVIDNFERFSNFISSDDELIDNFESLIKLMISDDTEIQTKLKTLLSQPIVKAQKDILVKAQIDALILKISNDVKEKKVQSLFDHYSEYHDSLYKSLQYLDPKVAEIVSNNFEDLFINSIEMNSNEIKEYSNIVLSNLFISKDDIIFKNKIKEFTLHRLEKFVDSIISDVSDVNKKPSDIYINFNDYFKELNIILGLTETEVASIVIENFNSLNDLIVDTEDDEEKKDFIMANLKEMLTLPIARAQLDDIVNDMIVSVNTNVQFLFDKYSIYQESLYKSLQYLDPEVAKTVSNNFEDLFIESMKMNDEEIVNKFNNTDLSDLFIKKDEIFKDKDIINPQTADISGPPDDLMDELLSNPDEKSSIDDEQAKPLSDLNKDKINISEKQVAEQKLNPISNARNVFQTTKNLTKEINEKAGNISKKPTPKGRTNKMKAE